MLTKIKHQVCVYMQCKYVKQAVREVSANIDWVGRSLCVCVCVCARMCTNHVTSVWQGGLGKTC